MTVGRTKATYADVLAAPEHKVAEVLDGELYLSPRPAPRHALAHTVLGSLLGPPFHMGRGGPGGWLILMEPELHLHDDIVVPDLAGWRIERMPRLPKEAFFSVAPDWVCEVLSPSTRRIDRVLKRPIYAKNGVGHMWLVDPLDRSLETHKLMREHWLWLGVGVDNERVRAEPFDAIELELGPLWETAPPAPADPAPPP
ncbi:MAG: Uma2 family endonuclease [Kofleriaceae bacterium]|nr:MAG: Uma2 family endonuclease [Kofleriaceae bacterium]MBZ0235350.1 Uma2 family endonuclease [Kofleriaceae bacterium]